MDLSHDFGDSAVLRMQVRVTELEDAKVLLSMSCGVYCTGSVDITAQLGALPKNEWQSIQIGLSCFADAGANLAKVDVPFQLQSSGKLELSFSELLITNTDATVSCQ